MGRNHDMRGNLRTHPDRAAALARYRELAPGYDASCWAVAGMRRQALALLAPAEGDVVFDVACGTGPMLPDLARCVGPSGRVIGIEQSPEMLAIARERVAREGVAATVTLLEAAAEECDPDARADRFLFFYTHDVFQSPLALERLFYRARPGARVVAAGARLLPWWGAPLNLWTVLRTRRYLTTYRGLGQPWQYLLRHCPDFAPVANNFLGTSYIGVGTVGEGTAVT
ncbi:MAG: methyltransferase domain-containing protein [Betaproteobacteria bacterium]|nr:MAG: methyltransferase domain-containing protein [Betaproteobacteria bacterium]